MATPSATDVEALLAPVRKLAAGCLIGDEARLFAELLPRYFAHVAPADLEAHEPRDLLGMALAHLRLARQRPPETPAVQVINPGQTEHGWSSPHTVVQIVTDDMPFLVDSVRVAISAAGLGIHLVVHPMLDVRRDDDGDLAACAGDGGANEAWIHLEVDRLAPERREELRQHLLTVLDDVRVAVEDWPTMRSTALAIAEEVEQQPSPTGASEARRAAEFLRWLADDHFTFLGYREYEFRLDAGPPTDDGTADELLAPITGTGLGILRDDRRSQEPRNLGELPPEARAKLLERSVLLVTTANRRSDIHRSDYLEDVAVKRFDEGGRVVGQRRFLGLYAARVSRDSVFEIPLIRDKVLAVIDRTGFVPESHSGRRLRDIVESYPREELFQMSVDELEHIVTGILDLQDRRQVRLFVRRDDFARFVSCLVFLPRDRFSTARAEQMVAAMEEAFGGVASEHDAAMGTGALARIDARIQLAPDAPRSIDTGALERRLAAIARDWSDDLRAELVTRHGEDRGLAAFAEFADAFTATYRETYTPQAAADDIERIRRLDAGEVLVTNLERPLGAAPGEVRFVLLRPGDPMTLSAVLPLLEHLGASVVDERPFEIRRPGHPSVWRYDIGLRTPASTDLEDSGRRDEFSATFSALHSGELESDGLNGLVLAAGLSGREVSIMRAYAKYLRQIGLPFSPTYVEETLGDHPPIVRDLVALFAARLDPDVGADDRDTRAAELTERVRAALDEVPSLDEDRILRSFLTLVEATSRTNVYRPAGDVPGGGHRPVISFKLDPTAIPDLPQPRPKFEIWVYSPRVEGVHLRGGPVARGGIRWSDRLEDFRTEVLGLMKAQMVKNAVIVPVGAKGGFVVKRRHGMHEAMTLRDEAEACYRDFIAGLLDVTDNVVGGAVVPPPSVVRHDSDDAYLVVAADKGTATFSDVANEISARYGFWLGDAFASGGSAGYDHKEMGITARGAWESVRRHARTLGIDADRDQLTVVGIGDMSGDVFGNGMLRSPHLKLVAAFDHRHVFLDPDPDPARAYAERKRLFELPRSSWDDYDRSALSEGGGIFPRSAKAIPLSAQMRTRLGVEGETLTPHEVISAILRAPVDLLWNGGIGTYVKSAHETHADVGDRANDALRVNGDELRVRMVVEGGNLGLTQRGRVEYALAGGLVFTDAIDNSAGVDCSDHEVNIKILLDSCVASGDLTLKQRNELLAAMEDEVGELVLEDNRAQTLALTIARAQAAPMVDVHTRYLRSLEQEQLIDRQIEFLPAEKQLGERAAAGLGLSTPELAVLLAYTKTTNVAELLRSDLPDEPYVQQRAVDYFPSLLRERFAAAMANHRLRREIISTQLTNAMVNRAGISFDHRMTEETGANVPDITRAHIVAGDAFGLDLWWEAIDDLGTSVDVQVQLDMLLDLRRMVERGVLWLLRHRRPPLDLGGTVAAFRPGVDALAVDMAAHVPGAMGASLQERLRARLAAGVPRELAERSAVWPLLHTAFDIVEIAVARGRTPIETAGIYWGLFEVLDVAWLWERIGTLPRADRWQSHARAAQRDDLLSCLRDLTGEAMRAGDMFTPPSQIVRAWTTANERAVRRVLRVFAEIRTGGTFDLTTLSVALRQLRNVVLATGPA